MGPLLYVPLCIPCSNQFWSTSHEIGNARPKKRDRTDDGPGDHSETPVPSASKALRPAEASLCSHDCLRSLASIDAEKNAAFARNLQIEVNSKKREDISDRWTLSELCFCLCLDGRWISDDVTKYNSFRFM